MGILSKVLDFGKSETLTPREYRLLKFSNLVFFIVLCFIIANLLSFFAFGKKSDSQLILVLAFHFILIAVSLYLNVRYKYFLAKVNFGFAAVIFVSYYSVAYGQEGFNYLFLPMIIFLIYNMFDAKEKLFMWLLITFASISYFIVLYINYIEMETYIKVEKSFREMQGFLALVGNLALTIVFGLYNSKLIINAENKLLAEKSEVHFQKKIIENVHNEILESIAYAKRL